VTTRDIFVDCIEKERQRGFIIEVMAYALAGIQSDP